VRLPAPFQARGEHIAIGLPGAEALFTTRRGGVSEGPYATLNLGLWTEDDPERVRANRRRVAEAVGARFAQGRQVHGAHVRRVLDGAEAEPAEADGQATALAGVAPVVLVADCLPIALAVPGAVAMLHVGWRGLAAGVVEEGVAAVSELAGRAPVAAAIGPGAGGCCYRVGEDVHAALGGEGRRGDHLDLKAIAARRLADAGVGEVHDVGLCTICADPALFFSHRRDRGVTGRQAGVVWRT
jgi:YfiH family protein